MKLPNLLLYVLLLPSISCQQNQTERSAASKSLLRIEKKVESLSVFLENQVLLTQEAKKTFRPFLHPIYAPDGEGVLTEYSPGHHKHQTGLYWGFTRINGEKVDPDTILKTFYSPEKTPEQQAMVGRDFFHHPGKEYWKRVSLEILKESGETVSWLTSYEMLDERGVAIMIENQTWTARQEAEMTVLDLEWEAEALTDIRVGAFGYGGLFLRMPWHKDIEGAAVNSTGQKNEEAEGQKANWVDVGMEIEGRSDWGHIAILDHPKNRDHPSPWRVDGQLGIGPCPAIEGDWEIAEGDTERIRYQLLVYTGKLKTELVDKMWEKLKK